MVKIKDNTMFWGVTLDGGKRYTQTVERSFHISMASLEPKMELSSSPSKIIHRPISVMVVHDKAEFILCTLEQGRCYQQPLDLNFTEGEEVTLFLNGDGVVHLTGYLIDDAQFSEEDVFDEEEDIEDESEEEAEEEDEESDEEIPQLTHVKDTKHKQRKDGKKKKGVKRVVEKLRFEEEEDEEVSYDIPDYVDYDQEDETESEEEVPKKFLKSDQLNDDDEDTNDSTLDDDAEQIQKFISRKGKGKQLKSKSKSAQEKLKKARSPVRETVQQFVSQEDESNELAGLSKKKKRKRKSKLQSSEIEEPRTSADYSSEVKTITVKKRLLSGGIKMEELKIGHGPQAAIGKTLHVYYTGRLANSGDVFDSKVSGKPFTFRLGKGEVIKGWDVAFQGLRVGGKRRLSIPPSLGYMRDGTRPSMFVKSSGIHFQDHLEKLLPKYGEDPFNRTSFIEKYGIHLWDPTSKLPPKYGDYPSCRNMTKHAAEEFIVIPIGSIKVSSYGGIQAGPIPPNSTLLFDVELKAIS